MPPHDPTDELFAEWWSVVPKREKRKEARSLYAAALRKTTPTVLLDAMRAYAELVRAERRDPHYISHPSSWLRGERWNDDRPATPPSALVTVGYSDADRHQPSRSMTGAEWAAESRGTA